MTHYKLLLLLVSFFCITSLYAQKRNFLMYKDSVLGKDTLILNVEFSFGASSASAKQRQYSISIEKNGRIVKTYDAKDIVGYREGGTTYAPKVILVNGERRKVLLPRIYWKEPVQMYVFITDEGNKEYYFQNDKDENSPLHPMRDDAQTGYVNPLKTYLEEFPIAQDNEEVKAYIRSMKPTVNSFRSRYKVCRTGNANYIPRIRWGVLAGAGIAKLFLESYDFKPKLQGFVGVFADIPLIDGFSFHPELTYRKYAFSKLEESKTKLNVVYNRQDFVLPLMLRYTLVSLKGKILPYMQLGAELGYALKNESASQYTTTDPDDFIVWTESGIIKHDKFGIAYTAGIGTEWKIRSNHSLFLDLRYCKETTKDYLTGYYAVVSFNL